MLRLSLATALVLFASSVGLAGSPATTEQPKIARESHTQLVFSAPGSESSDRFEVMDSAVVVLPGATSQPRTGSGPIRATQAPAAPPDRGPVLPGGVTLPEPPRIAPPPLALLRNNNTVARLVNPRSGARPQALRPQIPDDFDKDSGLFLQRRLGIWREDDARRLFGTPLRDRPAYDSDKKEDGHIFAFPDPSQRYREFELDFDQHTGYLRTVFIYPKQMKWDDCRRVWGANVVSTEAANGRRFHSYENRRLDVLVDSAGTVISLGLY